MFHWTTTARPGNTFWRRLPFCLGHDPWLWQSCLASCLGLYRLHRGESQTPITRISIGPVMRSVCRGQGSEPYSLFLPFPLPPVCNLRLFPLESASHLSPPLRPDVSSLPLLLLTSPFNEFLPERPSPPPFRETSYLEASPPPLGFLPLSIQRTNQARKLNHGKHERDAGRFTPPPPPVASGFE